MNDLRARFSTPSSAVVAVAIVAVGLAACSSGEGILGESVSNTPPQTRITATPPAISATDARVSFYWTGNDLDGEVAHYEWRLSTNGPDGVIDQADTLGLAWNSTEATDSTFAVTANVEGFEPDVSDSTIAPELQRYWQSHTFFVRAVDDHGLADPTPAHVSFTATTLAPVISIDFPEVTTTPTCVDSPLALSFGWSGVDPDNFDPEPEAVRYKLIFLGGSETPCLSRAAFAESDFLEDYAHIPWSEWIPYLAAQDSGRVVRFSPQGVNAGDSFLFAVQARDIAGAVTPTFEWGVNVRHVRVSARNFPYLSVTERFLGTEEFVSVGRIERYGIATTQPVEFDWSADASSYAGAIQAYRYGFDVSDVNDPADPGWAVDWGSGPQWQRALPRTFDQGSPNFVVQCRDNSGTVTRAFYQFQVIQIARRSEQRALLLVDDHPDKTTQPVTDDAWDAHWERLLRGVRNFQYATDTIDAEEEPLRLTFSRINDYKAVLWWTGPQQQTFLQNELAPYSLTVPRFNWLEVYQRFVGNVLMVGPGAMYRSVERTTFIEFPIIFADRRDPPYGFGAVRTAEGRVVPRGIQRYPYVAWCLESVDLVRPSLGNITGETSGLRRRQIECDALTYARVAPDFVNTYRANPAQLANLVPTPARRNRDNVQRVEFNSLKTIAEEFYNRNTTPRDATLNLRSCQVPMFLHIARRDVDNPEIMTPDDPFYVGTNEEPGSGYLEYWIPVEDPLVELLPHPTEPEPATVENCEPARRQGLRNSRLTGAPVAVASSAFIGPDGQKQGGTVQTPDFLFGFNPIGFEVGPMRLALEYVLLEQWRVDDR